MVEDYETGWYISRCTFSPEKNQDVCIRYRMDAYEYDRRRHIRKYFIKNPQYQFQMFNSLSFVEDDSIGITQYGRCLLIEQD
ncbi:MAG: hypothetical protein A2V90_06560 [Gammaproteobacteria bacterium RBG_16_57_12]|nr:MAG: hypothetical protein A2V90_06560 [Gammaproteobacteria bacterium RBG_16_57_12]